MVNFFSLTSTIRVYKRSYESFIEGAGGIEGHSVMISTLYTWLLCSPSTRKRNIVEKSKTYTADSGRMNNPVQKKIKIPRLTNGPTTCLDALSMTQRQVRNSALAETQLLAWTYTHQRPTRPSCRRWLLSVQGRGPSERDGNRSPRCVSVYDNMTCRTPPPSAGAG